jgi:glycosyltransferase involved in cell wall biosynthesis
MPVNVLIEGWRGINHSYALVNQFQLLALMRRPEVRLFHRDLPFYDPNWNPALNASGLRPGDAAKIAALSAPPGDVDIVYRIAFPFRHYGADSRRIFCFGTCESQRLEPFGIYRGEECRRTYANDAVEIVTPSRWSAQGFLKAGFRPEAVHVVPHGIEPSYFYPLSGEERAAIRADLGLPPDAFVFLNAGAMTGNKGIDTLILAFAEIRRRYPQAMLLLKDQRNLYSRSSAQGVIAGLRNSVPERLDSTVLHAIKTNGANFALADLRLLYGACDAYVSPYRAEGFNLTPLEAAACGIPIAVTKGGSTDDYADPLFALDVAARTVTADGGTALEPELDSLIAVMEAMIERRTPQIDMKEGAAWIAEHFTWDRAAAMLTDLFAR